MNNLKPVPFILFLFLLVLMIIPGSCRKDHDNNPEPTVPETTKVITDQDWNDNIISIDSSTWTLTFKPAIRQKYDLAPGDILISSKGQGLLRKVSTVIEEFGNVVVTTEEGTIVEALPEGRLSFNVNLAEKMQEAKILYMADGVKFTEPGDSQKDRIALTFSLEKELDDHLTIAGELSISPSISGQIAWSGTTPDTVIIQYTIEENLEITGSVDILSLSLEKEITLVTVELPTFTIYIGIPVLITPELSLVLGANVDVSSEMSSGVYQNLQFTAGFQYIEGNIDPICNMEKDLGPIPPSLSNTLEAKAYVKPQIAMKIYQVLSPNLALEFYALLEAELGGDPWWTLYAGLSGTAGFEIGKWGWEILDISVDLFDYKIPVADANTDVNNPPDAVFTVEPSEGGIGTLFHFDAGGCSDAEDEPAELQVRWDWENDGTWDTGYDLEKLIDHSYESAGDYTVKLQVKDIRGATGDTTQVITVTGNHAPEAAFTVNPPFGGTAVQFLFDASPSSDQEDPFEALEFRWDFNGDGIFETAFDYAKQATHQYAAEGSYDAILQVRDSEGATGVVSHNVIVSNGGTGEPCPGAATVTDYDGNIYNTALIGQQCWMKENLKTTHYRNGQPVDYPGSDFDDWSSNTTGAYAWYDDDIMWKDIYGALYNWYAVVSTNGLCPEGWHVSSDEEWITLEEFMSAGSNHGGAQLKSCRQVDSPLGEVCATSDHPRWDAGDDNYGTDDYGFSAFPGGRRSQVNYNTIGSFGLWWTTAEIPPLGKYYYLVNTADNLNDNGVSKAYGYSVRCLRDAW